MLVTPKIANHICSLIDHQEWHRELSPERGINRIIICDASLDDSKEENMAGMSTLVILPQKKIIEVITKSLPASSSDTGKYEVQAALMGMDHHLNKATLVASDSMIVVGLCNDVDMVYVNPKALPGDVGQVLNTLHAEMHRNSNKAREKRLNGSVTISYDELREIGQGYRSQEFSYGRSGIEL